MRLLPSRLVVGWVALACGACGANSAGKFAGAGGGTSTAAGGAATTTTTAGLTTSTGSGSPGTGGAAVTTGTTSGTTTGTTSSSSSSSSSSGSGGSASSASSSSSVSASSSSSAGGGSGDCHSDSDCPSDHCLAVTPGGFRVCAVPPVKATGCTSPLDLCCPATMTCPDQEPCYVGPLVPVCAGTVMPPHNQCGADQCAKDVDCAPGQVCAPAGTLGLEVNACVYAHCKVDTDCTAHSGGVCAPVMEPCCAATAGLFCTYSSMGGCRTSYDCPALPNEPMRYCLPDPTSGTATCVAGAPVCPG